MGVDRAIQKGLDKVEGAIEKGANDAINGRGGKAPAVSNGRVSANANGTIYYVSESGNNKNDGLSPSTPLKNIQKALDIAPAGSTIYVAAGNYYGLLRCGNIFVRKPAYIYGGFNG
ncbi:MAG TPA: hypothetical protein DCY24_04190, partial [Rikenellaceae bacterium]|nr:hypothetical protein [Rikenellaceae bacterium]